ncbi:MAG: SH3 domain-containing C40 family peptidase [Lachnospiraceae bacterium]|nr:SH3 domain-containing C40 family peptidase [Lachnospiraceae bacterium]
MFAFVSVPLADLYPKPDSSLLKSDELLYGTLIEILKVLPGSWYYIRTFYHYEGYIQGRYLLPLSRWNKMCRYPGKLMLVHHSCCDILNAPSVKSKNLLTLYRGSYLFCLTKVCSDLTGDSSHLTKNSSCSIKGNSPIEKDGYQRVCLFDGRIGWCCSSFLMECPDCSPSCLPDEDSFRREVVQTALLYLGCQYRWGGKSTVGIDCSGLTFMSYYFNQVIIYRDSSIQNGYPIHPKSPEYIKPGDLLYFPGHITLYLGGEHYIHSTAHSGSDGVVINSLNPLSSGYREDLHLNLLTAGSLF